MQIVSIATNNESVFIHIDKKKCDAHKINQLLDFIQLTFDDPKVIEVSDEEQEELSIWLNTIPDSEKSIAFSREIEL